MKREGREPAHLGLATANPVLELVIEMTVPVERVLGGRRRAAHIEVREGIVVGSAMQVFRLQNDAIAVEDESLESRRS